MENVSMIRRRIRDNNFIAKYYPVGTISKTDVVIAYMDDKVNKKLLKQLENEIKSLDAESLTVGDQSLLERLLKEKGAYNKFNPFLRVRYFSASGYYSSTYNGGQDCHNCDNSPTVMLIPVGIFDFFARYR